MEYKLTDKDGRTYGGTQWGENVTHSAQGEGNGLCSDGVIHAYRDPLVAVFANPVHGDFDPKTMLLWEGEAKDIRVRDGLKGGCKTFTTFHTIPLPVVTIEQRAEIAIRCALEVHHESNFLKWATAWLDGSNRTMRAARAAAAAAWAASKFDIAQTIHDVVRSKER